MIHVPSFEQFIGRILGPRERDIIAWLDWARRLTGRLAALVHDPDGRYAPLILAYFDWLAYATYDIDRPHLILAPNPEDARTLAGWCTQWPSRAGALSRHRTVAPAGHVYPRSLILDAHLAKRRGRRDTLAEAIDTILDSYGPDYTDHAIVILGDATAENTTFAETYRSAPMQPDSWFIYDTTAPILGPPPDIINNGPPPARRNGYHQPQRDGYQQLVGTSLWDVNPDGQSHGQPHAPITNPAKMAIIPHSPSPI